MPFLTLTVVAEETQAESLHSPSACDTVMEMPSSTGRNMVPEMQLESFASVDMEMKLVIAWDSGGCSSPLETRRETESSV